MHVIFTGAAAEMMVFHRRGFSVVCEMIFFFFTLPVDGFLRKAKLVTVNHQIQLLLTVFISQFTLCMSQEMFHIKTSH